MPLTLRRSFAVSAILISTLAAVPSSTAVAAVDGRLDQAAKVNGMSVAHLRELMKDESFRLDGSGRAYYVDPIPEHKTGRTVVGAAPFPLDQTFDLHSKTGSNRTIYLDFDGQMVSGTYWNKPSSQGGSGLPAANYPPFDPAKDGASFSSSERETVQNIWQRVAEDYAPFDVDVTTKDPGAAALLKTSDGDTVYGMRALISPSETAANFVCGGGCGGVAYLDVFSATTSGPDDNGYQPAWVFPQRLQNDAKNVAEGISHEVGHTFGLEHDGFGNLDYYDGANNDNWAPIMGTAYDQPIGQFSLGEYTGATNKTQDDIAIIALTRNAGFRVDEAGGTTSAAASAVPAGPAYIHNRADIDVYSLGTCSGPVALAANPAPVSPNLDIALRLLDSTGGAVAAANPPSTKVNRDVASGMNASISQSVTAGAYFLEVDGVGKGTPTSSYSDYGSVGAYTLSVTGCSPVSGVAPTAPTSVSASANGSSSSVAVKWAAPSSDGGSPITGYTVTRNGAAPVTVAASTLQYTFTGLSPVTSYNFTVTATNAAGTGPAATVSATTAPGSCQCEPPDAPRGTAASANGSSSSIAVTWSAPALDGGSPITGYTVTRNGSAPVTVSASTLQYTFTGLAPATKYDFTVTAKNAGFTGQAATVSASTAAAPVVLVPEAPTATSASANGSSTSIVVTWSAPSSDGGSPITGYTVTRDGAAPVTVAASTLQYTFTGLASATTYGFTVTATNTAGAGPAATATASTAAQAVAPGAPAIGNASSGTGGGQATATARWLPPASDGGAAVSGYRVFAYQLDAYGRIVRTFQSAVLGAERRSVTLILPRGRYRFAVSAQNSAGFGVLSAKSVTVVAR